MSMDRELQERLERMSREGDVTLTGVKESGKWSCSWLVGGVLAEGWGFSVETAVYMACEEMKKKRRAEKLARETSAAVRAYLYNPQRIQIR